MDTQPQPSGLPQAASDEEERLRKAYQMAEQKLHAERQQAATGRRAEKGIVQKGVDAWKSSGAGIAKAGFETYDFIFGEPREEEKSDLRRGVEQRARELAAGSPINSLSMGVSQFATGLIGAGKLMAPLKAAQRLQQAGKAGRAIVEIGKGAATGAVVLDPHEERLSNLIEQFPALRNPVTDYLAADPQDSAAEGRLKNALEGIGLDLAIVGTFAAAAKALKHYRAGDDAGAEAALDILGNGRQAETPSATQGSPQASAEPQAGLSGQPHSDAAPGPSLSQRDGTSPVDANTAVDRRIEFEERAAILEHEGGLPRGEAERRAAEETGYTPIASETATETHTAPSAPEGSTTPARAPAPTNELPRVKEADEASAASASPVRVTPDDVSAILRAADEDLAAITKHGSREAALEAGAVLSRGSRLPWQKLQSDEDLRTFMDSATTVLRDQMDAAKGGDILKDSALATRVQQMADYFGEAPDLLMGELTRAGDEASSMAARMEAAYRVSNAMFQDTYAVAFKVRNGMLDEWGGDAARAGEELRAKLTTSVRLLAAAKSMSSNSGRALRRMRGQFKLTPEDLDGIKALDTDRMADLLASTQGDPRKLAQVAAPGFLRRVLNEGTFLLTNNLLWMWPTHLMNITSSLLMIAGRPTEKLIGSFAVGPHVGNTMRRQAVKEYAATMAALGDGWAALVEAFKRGDSILAPHNTEYFQGAAPSTALPRLQWTPMKTPSDLIENGLRAASYRNIVGLPTRTLGAVDEFFKTLRYRAVVQAEAAVEAMDRGLTGADYEAFIRQRLEDAIDPATGRATDERALREAQIATFQQELAPGTLGATIQQVRSRHPLLHFVIPFVKTPINVLRYSVKMTPGLNLLQEEFRKAITGAAGAEAQAHAVGQMALGGSFMAIAAALALNGKLTGAGPRQSELRRELQATGWKPFSYVMEDVEGNRTYVPLGRFDPVGLALSSVAAIVEAMQANPEADMEIPLSALSLALSRNFADRTFLANIGQAVEAMSEPEKRGEKWLGNLLGNLVPASSLLRGTNPDPYLREARDLIDGTLKSLPGYSETLPTRRNWLGEPVLSKVGLLGHEEFDVVEAEHNRIMLATGRGIYTPSPRFEDLDLRDITLTEGEFAGRNAYEALQELSGKLPIAGQKSLRDSLRKLIESEAYQEMPDGDSDVQGTRLHALAAIVGKYRERAKKYLIAKSAELREMVGQRKREARDARLKQRRANREANAPKTFGEMLGLEQPR